ncbi:RagB/SusD family nutrient uptake outer membrane protein [Parafilimonas sp.]|uniref:RagB/SusD family nutrient uptake outer membrane protein n=1 Tax=Parafilimonas sp. TaxID=1969739 RepID=UPI0039E34E6E
MKKTFVYFILFIAIAQSACKKDFLDRNPLDAYSNSSLWSSQSDALAALYGCYNGGTDPSSGESGWETDYSIYYLDAVSDNVYSQFYWEGYQDYGNGTVTSSDGNAYTRWNYKTIQRCNWFLENVDATPMDDTLKAQYKGEARFLRAYQYFIMSQLYGDVPLVTTTITTEEANAVTRTAAADVRSFIVSELDTIADILPESYSGSDVGRITKGAALALKARIELFDADYASAITDYETVMGLGYSLYSSYADLFRIGNENNSEVILDVQYKENDFANWLPGVMATSSQGGWSSLDPTQSIVDAYEMSNGKTIDETGSGYDADNPYENRDPRLAASIVYPGQLYEGFYYNSIDASSDDYYNGDNNSKTGYLIKKYISNLSEDYSDMWNTGLNVIVIRYAEVLLGYAEAKIEQNDIDESVYSAIDAVRTRAGMPEVDRTVYNSQSTLRTLVRRERRVELAFEGLRWFDIQRWKIGSEVRNGTVYGIRPGTVNASTGAVTYSGDNISVETRTFNENRDYLWPVPQSEIDINNSLTQNSGY